MTTLADRPHTALLVIDMQRDVVAAAHRRDEVIARINFLLDRARAEGVPVVWVQHSDADMPIDSEGWRFVPELVRRDDEPLVHKRFGDSFEATELEEVLAERGVGRLVVTGAQTDVCVRSTLHGGLVRGYDVTLVGDAHTAEDRSAHGAPPPEQVIAHTNLYWRFQSAPGRRGGTVNAAEVDFGPAERATGAA
ncbi:isochorismatase family protein [Streptomyces triticirhizae]|uniref:Isochorismatase family protein n=1 Tax=Streptomyces triticirhizae TaxID=2483353 RepID=A0A3M2LMC2_9ACTN|nr:isochorismatase family protein [Streptomyces triticirhizae]RMI35908.1 isochorismatase family protein [Streptomyces triticirhizae]